MTTNAGAGAGAIWRGFRVEILRYGDKRRDKYKLYEFRAALDRASCCIFLTENEPQGLAASEAWSMDVPTFVFRGAHYPGVDIVPYLTSATGRYWTSFEDLLALIEGLPRAQYRPREWTLQHMTDAACAQLFVNLTDKLYSQRAQPRAR